MLRSSSASVRSFVLGAIMSVLGAQSVLANQPPVANNDSGTTRETRAVTINVTANDTDPDGDPVRLVFGNPVIVLPTNGTTVRVSDTSITYTPNTGFTGGDTFRYRITDGNGLVHSAVVTVSVIANQPPVASPDSVATRLGMPITVDVTANDSDPDGDPIRLVTSPILTAPTNGVATRVSDDTILYTPSGGFEGTDTFRYRITDGFPGSVHSAVVTVIVAANAQPVAMPDRQATPLDVAVTINVTANDSDPEGDPIRLVNAPILVSPVNGLATRVSDTTIRYVPNLGFSGTDTFRYRITDGFPGSVHSALVTVRVDNKSPNATPETAEAHVNTPITIQVTANDSDPDGDTVVLVPQPILIAPTQGTATRVSDTAIRYTPNSGFVGTDSFRYRITDGWGAVDSAVVTLNLTNRPPVARNDSVTTNVDSPITIDVKANDSDPDGDGFSVVAIANQPANGTATRLNGQEVRYTPLAGFTGNDSFVYRIRDDFGATATAVVSVTVATVPEPEVTSVDGDPVFLGQVKNVTVHGGGFTGANVYVATEPATPDMPPRVYPVLVSAEVNAAGTAITARIDATAVGVDGFYNLAIETPGGTTAAQFRIVDRAPVVDLWTPSEPTRGAVHLLQVVGLNLAGANVVWSSSGIKLLDLDNDNDQALSGLIFISNSVPAGPVDLRIDGVGGSVTLSMNVQAHTGESRLPTSKVATGSALPGIQPEIYFQDPVSPHQGSPYLTTEAMHEAMRGETHFPSSVSADERAQAKMFQICVTLSLRSRISYGAVLLSLFNDSGDPLTQEAVNALLPGQSLDFSSLTLAVSGFLEIEFLFRVCNGGVTDVRFCIRGGIAVIVPAVGGWSRVFDICFGFSLEQNLDPSGRVNSHTYTSSNGCVQATDRHPGFITGEREGQLQLLCCENATISLQTTFTAFQTQISVGGPILEVQPLCTDPPSGQGAFRLFLDVDDDNGFDPNNAVPIGDLDDLSGYVPGTTTSGASIGDLSMSPQSMKLVAAYVDIQGGSARVVAPPNGISQVSFVLTNTSAFVGVAGNWPVMGGSTAPDFHLGPGSTQMTMPFATDHTARVDFVANDYGGFTTVEASPDGGVTRQVVRIPKDDRGNMLPDTGWRTKSGTAVSSGSLVADADADLRPATTSAIPANGKTGDGLSVFEEYRGFMVRGKHRRTHPNDKDIFISSNMATGISYASPNLPLTVHRIWGQDEAQANEYNTMRDINFNQTNSGSGGNVPGHSLQKAIRGLGTATTMACLYGFNRTTTGSPWSTPNETSRIEIYTNQHTTACLGVPSSQVLDEQRRSFGHELGHAINVCHRPTQLCPNPVGGGPSIMSNPVFPGGNAQGDPASQYDVLDTAQIRVHIKHP